MAKIYETVVIVDAMIPDEAISSEFEAIEKRITAKGSLVKTDKWGRRKLAYPINGRTYGDYCVYYYEAKPGFPKELESAFRINENILRWLTVADNPVGVPEDKPEDVVEESSPEEKKEVIKAKEAVTEEKKDETHEK